jgi:putative ABC transport system substrate-binding protein
MRRREFIALLGSAACGSGGTAIAQMKERVKRLGALIGYAPTDAGGRSRFLAFVERLASLGWIEHSNLFITSRWHAGAPEQAAFLTKEVLDLDPDIIFVHSSLMASAVVRATRTTPIVFVQVTDPVSQGLVKSFATPGGNVTGFTNFEFSMGGKWLELLKELAPQVTSVSLLFNPRTTPYALYVRAIEAAAPVFGIELSPTPVQSASEIEMLIASLEGRRGNGLVVLPDAFTTLHLQQIVDLAIKFRLPGMYPFRYFATAGGLVAYGVDVNYQFQQAADYVDRILRGADPSRLPVQAPTKFELVINLKTASVLALTVPPTLLARADEVIE